MKNYKLTFYIYTNRTVNRIEKEASNFSIKSVVLPQNCYAFRVSEKEKNKSCQERVFYVGKYLPCQTTKTPKHFYIAPSKSICGLVISPNGKKSLINLKENSGIIVIPEKYVRFESKEFER